MYLLTSANGVTSSSAVLRHGFVAMSKFCLFHLRLRCFISSRMKIKGLLAGMKGRMIDSVNFRVYHDPPKTI